MRFSRLAVATVIGGLALSARLAILLNLVAGLGSTEHGLRLHRFSQLINRVLDGARK